MRLSPIFKIDVGIDSAFSVAEKEAVIEAFIRWQEATNYVIVFHLGNFAIGKLIKHSDDPSTWYAMNIIKAESDYKIVKRAQEYHKRPLNGLAILHKEAGVALIIQDKIYSREDFIGVTMHEIGHLLGLGHSEAKTIMHKYSGSGRPAAITQHDLDKLVEFWQKFFGLGAMHVSKSGATTSES